MPQLSSHSRTLLRMPLLSTPQLHRHSRTLQRVPQLSMPQPSRHSRTLLPAQLQQLLHRHSRTLQHMQLRQRLQTVLLQMALLRKVRVAASLRCRNWQWHWQC
jgi:hypothetical protein